MGVARGIPGPIRACLLAIGPGGGVLGRVLRMKVIVRVNESTHGRIRAVNAGRYHKSELRQSQGVAFPRVTV